MSSRDQGSHYGLSGIKPCRSPHSQGSVPAIIGRHSPQPPSASQQHPQQQLYVVIPDFLSRKAELGCSGARRWGGKSFLHGMHPRAHSSRCQQPRERLRQPPSAASQGFSTRPTAALGHKASCGIKGRYARVQQGNVPVRSIRSSGICPGRLSGQNATFLI